MKRLFIIVLAMVLVTSCGRQRHDSDAEDVDGATQADTANIDASGNAEAAPTIDQGEVAKAEEKHEDSNVTAAAPPEKSDDSVPATPSVDTAADTSAPANHTPTNSTPPSAVGSGQIADYAVQRGDTLMKIAFNLYGDVNQWKTIYELNKDAITSANQLISGVKLKYDKPASEPNVEKNGDPYMIKKGDTLGTIADDIYAKKSKWKKIYENNRSLIKDPNRIYAGFYLYYQITEAEKHEAEQIKAKRGGTFQGNQLSEAEKLPDSAANVMPTTPKAGGMNSLLAPQAARKPASK